jgi:hypothetical protein
VDLKLGFGSGLKSASRSETNFRSDPVAKRDPKLLFQIRNTEIIGFVINFAPRCGYGSVNQDYRSADPDLKEVFMDPQQQSSGSVTFWYGSGSLDPYTGLHIRIRLCLHWIRIRINNYPTLGSGFRSHSWGPKTIASGTLHSTVVQHIWSWILVYRIFYPSCLSFFKIIGLIDLRKNTLDCTSPHMDIFVSFGKEGPPFSSW